MHTFGENHFEMGTKEYNKLSVSAPDHRDILKGVWGRKTVRELNKELKDQIVLEFNYC